MLLFTIKFTHSLIIIYMLVCLFVIWQYALTALPHPFVKWAIASLIAEGVVFIAWGFECPLTIWALDLGDETGVDWLSDILLLHHVEYTDNFAIFALSGIVLSLRQYLQQQAA